ncbi:MAG: hypothetical protein QXM92_04215 [Candidatus Anstonellales archaeon]
MLKAVTLTPVSFRVAYVTLIYIFISLLTSSIKNALNLMRSYTLPAIGKH